MTPGRAYVAAIFGATDQGKSATVKIDLAATPPARLLVWDYMDEYGDHARAVRTIGAAAAAARAPQFSIRYVGMLDGLRHLKEADQRRVLVERFDTFCALAYAAGNCVLVVEELQAVTLPGWAPPAWVDCTARGRHRRLVVFGLSQRPASVDKHFFGNANMVRTFRLNYAEDVACMANIVRDVEGVRGAALREKIALLEPLHYVERDMRGGGSCAGVLAFNAPPARRRASKKPSSTQKKSARR